MNADDIRALVDRLPGVYQPIYGHEELSDRASRACVDRLAPILDSCRQLARQLGRRLRILDLGCAQGFFTLSLAAEGADVIGLDAEPANIALCQALAQENPHLRVRFLLQQVEDVLPRLVEGEFDVALGLSVLHHLCHTHGLEYVRSLVCALADKLEVLYYEAALREDPLYWASSLPEDPRVMVGSFPFVHPISYHKTNLSQVRRPLFFCSARWWLLGGQLERIISWADQSGVVSGRPHFRAGECVRSDANSTRRYYFSEDKVAKYYFLEGRLEEDNRQEILREVDFLSLSPPVHPRVPKLYGYDIGEDAAWLVRGKLAGRPLPDAMSTQQLDSVRIVSDILDELRALEERGFYHRDVRVWNVLLLEDGGATLLDYGSVWQKKEDFTWPYDPFLSFLSFVWEVQSGKVPNVARLPFFSPEHFREPFRSWVEAIWRIPASAWSYARFRVELAKTLSDWEKERAVSVDDTRHREGRAWQATVERYLADLSKALSAVQGEKEELRAALAVSSKQQEELRRQIREVHIERDALRVQVEELNRWLQAVYTSTSWRITAPLRLAKTALVRTTTAIRRVLREVAYLPFRLALRVLAEVARWAARNPRLRSLARKPLSRSPALRARVRRLIAPEAPAGAPAVPSPQNLRKTEEMELPEPARRVLEELKAALEQAGRYSREP